MTLRRKLVWVTLLYLAEGFPYGLVRNNLPVYFRLHGVDLTQIGLMSLLGIPWTLKVLWSPLVDRYGTRQRWIVASLLIGAMVLTAIPWFDAAHPPAALWGLLLVLALAGATQDIAIDAYTIGLLNPGEEGVANGVRVSAYRVALILAGGGLIMLSGYAGWRSTYWIGAAFLVALALTLSASPALQLAASTDARPQWLKALRSWLARPGAAVVLIFVVTYKLGDAVMGPMVSQFWVDSGLSLDEIGVLQAASGVGATVAGALVGGLLTKRWGIFRALLWLGLAQALSNLGYAGAAWSGWGHGAVYAASFGESFTGGLGTAAFFSFLMHVCDKRHAATEYALLSALFGLAPAFAGATSGWGAAHLGYATFFALTFLLALPAFGLLPLIRTWTLEGPEPEPAGADV